MFDVITSICEFRLSVWDLTTANDSKLTLKSSINSDDTGSDDNDALLPVDAASVAVNS